MAWRMEVVFQSVAGRLAPALTGVLPRAGNLISEATLTFVAIFALVARACAEVEKLFEDTFFSHCVFSCLAMVLVVAAAAASARGVRGAGPNNICASGCLV